MKKYLLLSVTILITTSFWNCERDDICAEGTPTTPNIVMEFYDAVNTSDLKSVTDLNILSKGNTKAFTFPRTSKIIFPLKTYQNSTTIQLIQKNSINDSIIDNTDEITFQYSTKEIYISRACGFKSTFQLNSPNGAVLNTETDTLRWIQRVSVVKSEIENENETHIKIYF